ncbi:MAG: AtpZ/AtpI family protein [Bdellovibrionota bacterium]
MGLVSGELLVFIGGGYWAGTWLDQKWNSAPIFTAALALLGLGYAGWRISRLAKQWMK